MNEEDLFIGKSVSPSLRMLGAGHVGTRGDYEF